MSQSILLGLSGGIAFTEHLNGTDDVFVTLARPGFFVDFRFVDVVVDHHDDGKEHDDDVDFFDFRVWVTFLEICLCM